MSAYDKFIYPDVNSHTASKMGLTKEEFESACKVMSRTPNYVELGCISALWSEHCSYKSSKKYLKTLPVNGEDVVVGPGENAGIVRIDGDICVCFKIESHNHPTYHDPFNGSATGVGGILRDIFTMGAKPVAGLGLFRFGDLTDIASKERFKKALEGAAFYSNNFGLPIVGADSFFHSSFTSNPLVNVFALGIVKESNIYKSEVAGIGNLVVYLGAKTGREGILGAVMASESIESEDGVELPRSQIGNPLIGKNLMQACMDLMEKKLVVGIQDMGAAGLTSSSFEMAAKSKVGLTLDLSKVPVKEEGMTPYELMLSETQERMLLVIPKDSSEEVLKIAHTYGVDCAVLGEVDEGADIVLKWGAYEVGRIDAYAITDAAKELTRPVKEPVWLKELSSFDQSSVNIPASLEKIFFQLLTTPVLADNTWVINHFNESDPYLYNYKAGFDCGLIKIQNSIKGIGITVSGYSRYCLLDPYLGVYHTVLDAFRNLSAMGAKPVAVTNCLNYGNPENPHSMYQLVKGIEGLKDACEVLSVPVVSGNVSLYNESEEGEIYPTAAIGAVGIIDEANIALEPFFKGSNTNILLLGEIPENINASEYLERVHEIAAGVLPDISLQWHKRVLAFLPEAIKSNLILSARNIRAGGLSIGLAKMSLGNMKGIEVHLPPIARADSLLFGESPMIVIEVEDKDMDTINTLAVNHGIDTKFIGKVRGSSFSIATAGRVLITSSLEKMAALYNKALVEAVK